MSDAPAHPVTAPRCDLIGPGDPAPFEVVNRDGRRPILLICDHASNAIPRAMDGLGLDDEALGRHIAYDIGAAGVTRRLSARLGAPAVLSGYSRLLIDPNRAPGDPQSVLAVSDAIPIPGNEGLSEQDILDRAHTFHAPYHQAVDDTLAHLWRKGTVPALFSIHTFTPSLGGQDRYWHVAVLWNRDPRLARPLMEGLSRRGEYGGLHVGDNEPYSGRDLAYSIDSHGQAAGLPYCAIEIRQDLVETDVGQDLWADILGDVLEEILADPGLHRVEHY
jgi:predicted N-formylglutamate amidohydrolase